MLQKPYFLCGAVLIFWGIFSKNIALGIISGLIIEISYLLKNKINVTSETSIKISDMTSFIFISSIFLLYLNNEPYMIMPLLAKWLPMIFYILIFTQVYSTNNHIIIGTKLGKQKYTYPPMDIFFPYILLTLFSTTTLNNRSFYYFFFLFLFAAWSFLYIRNKRYPIFLHIFLIVFLFFLSYTSQVKFLKVYEHIRQSIRGNYNPSFIEKFIRNRMGNIPFEGVTALGDVGELKLSGKILFTAEINSTNTENSTIVYYLKDSAYDMFSPPNWIKKEKKFIISDLDLDDNWIVNESAPSNSGFSIKINQNLKGRKGLIPLPYGSYKLEKLGGIVENDVYGTFRIYEAIGRSINYTIWVNPVYPFNKKPENIDKFVLDIEKPIVSKIVDELNLKNMKPIEAVRTLSLFFNQNFKYTLRLERKRHRSYLNNFLNERKAGHCEYFATATVLILREAGIPARYVTGYVLAEKNPYDNNVFLVRERHGHAWAEVYINGKWIIIDNTPSIWLDEDEKNASKFEKINDYIYFLLNEIKSFFSDENKNSNKIITAIILILLLFLILRIYLHQKKSSTIKIKNNKDKLKVFKSIDSDFILIQKEIAKLKIPKLKHETLNAWINRIKLILKKQKNMSKYNLLNDELNLLITKYYKLRFDTENFSNEELENFNKDIKKWLENFKSKFGK